jgi:hypothetical protein
MIIVRTLWSFLVLTVIVNLAKINCEVFSYFNVIT